MLFDPALDEPAVGQASRAIPLRGRGCCYHFDAAPNRSGLGWIYDLHQAEPYTLGGSVSSITTSSVGVVHYSLLHAGEGWAAWWGCNTNRAESSTVVNGFSTDIYRWTGCADADGSTTGEMQVYRINGGAHTDALGAADDIFAFFSRH